ncbi:SOS response-associated peptidase family protein [Rhizobium sp. OAE497]|uniref:SOS response-associated peptidase family protein n=1 Tax=Rhizobium sp. OAE497 TaxID=2663796 RepID=UPI0018F6F7FB
MCNDYEQHIRYAEFCKRMHNVGLGIPGHQSEADLPQADDIRIGDQGTVLRAKGNVVELTQMTFGFPPKGRGGPVFNFRSEGRDFSGSQRCLVPASAFFEFTGKKYPKAKHRFTLTDSPVMAIASLWREGEGNQPPTFTMLTTSPGPDVVPIHNRQIVVLAPDRWADWLYLSGKQSGTLAPLPAGSLRVEQVRSGSD